MIDVRAFVVLALALSVNLPAQESEPAPTPQAPPAIAETKTKGVEHWIRDLGSDSFQTRLKAEGALRKLGKEALPALKKAADDESDSEVQWRVRRLVRQIEKGANQGLLERPKKDATEPEVTEQDQGQVTPRTRFWRQGLPDSVRDQFESLFEHFERDFGLDVPRARFFEDDFFKDLQEQMKTGRGTSQGTVLQIGPDGKVHVEITERNEKGEEERKVYDAPDMQSFQLQYPDVLKKNGLYLGFNEWPRTLRGFNGQGWQGFQLEPGQGLRPFGQLWQGGQDDLFTPATPAPAPVGKRLGIVVHQIPAELREHLDLAADTGLMVESVQEGSLAESLGLQRGDIVVQIESTPIGSSMDVQKVLGGIEAGKQVEVKFLRKGKEMTAKATKTEAVEEPKKLEAKKGKNATIR